MSYMMLHGLGDCTPELNCGCIPTQPFEEAAQQPDTTQPTRECPPTTTGPQTATQGRNEWSAGYVSARRFYGDTASLALDKIRDILADSIASGAWRSHVGCSGDPLGYFYEDLSAILDTATEPNHD